MEGDLPTGGSLWRSPNIPPIEITPVDAIMDRIQDKNITSYQEFIDASENLSEDQKFVLASAIAYSLNLFNYDMNLIDSELLSQEDFFSKLQDSLSTGEDNPLGVCKHIATHTEKTLNDLEIRSSAVSGLDSNGGHAYVVSKTENGSAVVNACYILTINTNNIEKTLQAYQKFNGVATFQHLFFEDDEFQYRLITKDAENFLNFIEYDESSEPLRSSLIDDAEPQPRITLTANLEDYLTSVEANMVGLFIKMGRIQGNISSPLQNMNLAQVGFKRNFSIGDSLRLIGFNRDFPILDRIRINPDLSLILGNIEQDTQLENNAFSGVNGNLIISTNFERGLNLTSRVGGVNSTYENPTIHDFILGGGVSYTLPIENINIQSYIVSQFSSFVKSLATWTFMPRFSELTTGITLDSNSDNSNFSIDSYYLWRIWEQGFGGEARWEAEGTGIDVSGQITFSGNDFNPDKYSFSIGTHLNLGTLQLEADWQSEGTNYDGERETQNSINLQLLLGL